jgi:hypothetical protein
MKLGNFIFTTMTALLIGLTLSLIPVTPIVQANPATQGGAPPLINYQGYLTDSSNQPLNGTAALQVGLYAAAEGGSPLWEELHPNVTVSEGYFTVLLGSLTPLSAANFSETGRYLQVSVAASGGFEALPRQPLAAVPYALQAVEAQNGWSPNGNSGTTPGSHYIGTTDAVSLTLAVNGSPALRLEPGDSPNLIGGYSGNSVAAGVEGATIGGGETMT